MECGKWNSDDHGPDGGQQRSNGRTCRDECNVALDGQQWHVYSEYRRSDIDQQCDANGSGCGRGFEPVCDEHVCDDGQYACCRHGSLEYCERTRSDHECDIPDDDDHGSNGRHWYSDGSTLDDQQWQLYSEHVRD